MVDEEYLSSPDTVYPVTVDPSFSFDVGASGIEDVPIYSGRPRYNHGYNTYNHVGYVDSSYKVGRLLVKFPGLMNDRDFTSRYTQLIDVTYYNYSLGGSTPTTISVYRYMGAGWTESGAKCNIVSWNGYTDLQDSKTVGAGGWYGFDITDAAQMWKDNPSLGNLGLLVKNSNESSASYDKPFASADYTAVSSRQPYVQVTYSDYVPVSQVCLTPTKKELSVNDTAYLTATVVPSNATNKGIIWSSSDSSVVSVAPYSNLICARKPGTAVITATSADNPAKFDTCTVQVFCGGANYEDVTKHNMKIQDDNYYVCSVCKYRVPSPVLQDESVLSKADLYAIRSLYHQYAVLLSLDRPRSAEAALATIDYIRSFPENRYKYAYKDANGQYVKEFDAEFNNVQVVIHVDDGKKCVTEWTLIQIMIPLFGLAPPPYGVMLSAVATLIAQEHPGASEISGVDLLLFYLNSRPEVPKALSMAIDYICAGMSISTIGCTKDCINVGLQFFCRNDDGKSKDFYELNYHYANGATSYSTYSEYLLTMPGEDTSQYASKFSYFDYLKGYDDDARVYKYEFE